MKTTFKSLILGAVMATSVIGSAYASCHMGSVDDNNVVNDMRGNQVTDVRGNCVYTKWKDGSNKCGAAAHKDMGDSSGLTLNERTIYFSFDSATLTPEGVYKLNRMLGNLETSGKQWTATIVGHADKMGDAGYNQALSNRRANTVKSYLASHGMKNATVSSLTAQGENFPVTTGCDAAGAKASTINCLQPDRRVEIRLTPTK